MVITKLDLLVNLMVIITQSQIYIVHMVVYLIMLEKFIGNIKNPEYNIIIKNLKLKNLKINNNPSGFVRPIGGLINNIRSGKPKIVKIICIKNCLVNEIILNTTKYPTGGLIGCISFLKSPIQIQNCNIDCSFNKNTNSYSSKIGGITGEINYGKKVLVEDCDINLIARNSYYCGGIIANDSNGTTEINRCNVNIDIDKTYYNAGE